MRLDRHEVLDLSIKRTEGNKNSPKEGQQYRGIHIRKDISLVLFPQTNIFITSKALKTKSISLCSRKNESVRLLIITLSVTDSYFKLYYNLYF